MSVTDSDVVKAAREYQAAYNAYIQDPLLDDEGVLLLANAHKRFEMVRPRTVKEEAELIAALADELERVAQA